MDFAKLSPHWEHQEPISVVRAKSGSTLIFIYISQTSNKFDIYSFVGSSHLLSLALQK